MICRTSRRTGASQRRCRAILIAIATLATACSGVGDFEVTRETSESIVDGSTNLLNDILPVEVVPPLELEFDLQSQLEEHDAKGAKAVRLTNLVINVTDTALGDRDEDNFDFLERIEFRVGSRRSDTDLDEVTVAEMDDVPRGATSLELDTDSSINLKPYAQEGIVITTRGAGTVPPDDVSVIGVVTIEVETL